jgi:transcriptional regulator GlxA family with amidase domain
MTNTYSVHISAILRVLIYIEEHVDESLLLEKLARIARISPFHFHRLFRAYTGETCLEYMQRLRLQRAREKLRYTDNSITSIALDVGYETSAGFSKIFQQVLGRSPREYRNVRLDANFDSNRRLNTQHEMTFVISML